MLETSRDVQSDREKNPHKFKKGDCLVCRSPGTRPGDATEVRIGFVVDAFWNGYWKVYKIRWSCKDDTEEVVDARYLEKACVRTEPCN